MDRPQGPCGHGGARAGAGRKPGPTTRTRYALDLLESVMRDESASLSLRVQSAMFLASSTAGIRRKRYIVNGGATDSGDAI